MFTLAFNKKEGLFLNYSNNQLGTSETAESILKDITDIYNNTHARGYESSMSASIHFIELKPIVIEIPDTIDDIMLLVEKEKGKGFKISTFNGLATRGTKGIKVLPEKAQALISTGIVPDLINEDFNKLQNNQDKKY